MFSIVHLHLMINHSPLYSELFAFAFLLLGAVRRNRTFVTIGLVVAVIAALCGLATDWTGDGAADYFKNAKPPVAGVETDAIGVHDQAATFFIISSCIAGAFALFVLWWGRKRERRRWMEIVAIVLVLWSVTVVMRVALLGGRIHHQEVRAVVHG